MTAARLDAPRKPQRDWMLILAVVGTALLAVLALISAYRALR